MKKLLLVVGIIFLFSITASAQVSKPFSIYAGGGISLTQGDWGDFFKNGYHGTAMFGFNAAPMIQILAKGDYHTFDWDSDVIDGSFDAILVGGALKLSPSLPAMALKPFGLAGGGLASYKVDGTLLLSGSTSTYESSDRESDFYFEIGGGVEMGSGPASFFAMIRYISIQSEGSATNFIPLTVGMKF